MYRIKLLISCLFLMSVMSLKAQQIRFDNVPPLSGGGNTAGGVVFNLTTNKPIIVDSLRNSFSTATGTATIWYNTTKINGQPTINSANGWVNLGSSAAFAGISPASTNPIPQNIPLGISIQMQPGDTFGIAIQWTGNVFPTTNTNIPTFSDGTVTIIADNTCAFTMNSGMTSWFTPRQINGGLVYRLVNRGHNDAGVTRFTRPISFCQGTQEVRVEIQNEGKNRIDSVRVNYTVDNSSVNTIYYRNTLDTFGSTNGNVAEISLGNFNFNSQAGRNFRVWTSYPNGVVDTITRNDTIQQVIKPALAGTFTIGGSNPDYPNFTSAVNDLKQIGVCGPVTFNVRAGNYNERITIDPINGASDTNTISFVGAGKSSTKITFSGSSTADFATILLNGADYLRFRDMTVEATGATNGVGILLTGQADYNHFTNLDISVNNTGTGTTLTGVAISGSATSVTTFGNGGNFNRFDKLNIDGGYYGMRLNGVSTSVYCVGNDVTNCTITNAYYYGIMNYYQRNFKINNNTIRDMRNSTNYALYNYYASNFTINANYVASNSYAFYNFSLNSSQYDANIVTSITNNMVRGGTQYGFYCSTCSNIQIHHNTVLTNGTGTAASTSYWTSITNAAVRNNIFYNQATGTSYAVFATTTANFTTLDNNNYYTEGSGLYYQSTTVFFNTLAAWRSAQPQFNASSYQNQPRFTSNTDLHVTDGRYVLTGAGVGVTTDFDGEGRSNTAPHLGADERVLTYNNAGIIEITSPKNFCTGNQDFKILLENAGANPIDSVRVDWTLNGTPQSTVYIRQRIDTVGSSSGNTLEITLAQLNWTGPQTKQVKVWTSFPNGVMDTVRTNDTIAAGLRPSFSGVTTIGGTGADYATFNEMINDINSTGVCGPVEVYIAPGTYNERITLGNIQGVSSTNTITFIGSGIGVTRLQFDATSTANFATVLMNGTDHITFRDMTIEALNATNGVGILLTNGADSNKFINLHVKANTTSTGTAVTAIALTGSATSVTTYGNSGNVNLFDSLLVEGGYYGIRLNGSSTSAYCTGNVITNCRFINQYYYGIYSYYQQFYNYSNNSLSQFRNSFHYAIYNYYGSNYIISANNIQSTNYGIYTVYTNRNFYDPAFTTIIYNNLVSAGNNYAYYNSLSDRLKIFHNTFSSATATYTAYFTSTTTTDVRNNIFVNQDGLAGKYAIAILTSATFDTLDYNNYYSAGTDLMYESGTVRFQSLAAWRAAQPQYNSHSVSQDPGFISPTNLHISTNGNPGFGRFIGISKDIDGDDRCPIQVMMGGDEIPQAGTLDPVAAFSMPDTFFVNSPVRVLNTSKALAGEPLAFEWFVDGVKASEEKNLLVNFTSTGSHTIALITKNCSGYDSIGYRIDVVNPSRSPISDFIADPLMVLPFTQSTQFTDISSHGATSWNWSITPNSGVTFTPNIASPEATFTDPGYYQVCLQTANSLGTGTTKCKPNYIYVLEDVWMCNTASSQMPAGRLSDDGWEGNYSPNVNCSYLLDPLPCASEVKFELNKFLVADFGDSLLIYDGLDANGMLLAGLSFQDNFGNGKLTVKAYSGKMFLQWKTNGSGQAAGFEGIWTSVADTSSSAPVADFNYSNPVYTKQPVNFNSLGQRNGTMHKWYFYNGSSFVPGFNGGERTTDQFAWNAAGTYPVALKVQTCAGRDSLVKNIVVNDPSGPPVVGFYTEQTRVPAGTTITLYDTTGLGPFKWKWYVSPSNKLKFETPVTNQNVEVTLYAPGFYTVTLWAENAVGADSLTVSNYIEVFDYCTPAVSTLNADLGISRVKFESIDNRSTIGERPYTNYAGEIAPPQVYAYDSYDITIERNTTADSMSRKVWIDWNRDGDFNDSLEQVIYETTSKTASFTGTISVPGFAGEGTTIMRVGTSYGRSANLPCGINPIGEFEDYLIEVVFDRTIPVITLIGQSAESVEQWYQYIDAGATAFDSRDGDLTSQIVVTSNVDVSNIGTYEVRYNVSDKSGNQAAEVIRIVNVTPDMTPPVITLLGTQPVNHDVNATYDDAGATAMDYFNRDLTPDLQSGTNLDVNALGTYYFYYTVTDGGGNSDSVARIINVVDNVNPTISIVGADTIILEVFGNINDPGYIAADNYDPNPTVVVDSSRVNTSATGTYNMTYRVTDGSGNFATASRVVIVQDTEAPVIALVGPDNITLEVNTPYIEQGATATDNYCTNVPVTISGSVNTSTLGTNELTYSAIDCEGNAAADVKRTVEVLDRTAPVITLIGNEIVFLARWESYTDLGYNLSDNYFSNAQINVETLGDWVNSSVEGLYYIQYRATDGSGNIGLSAKRVIDVRGTNGIAKLGNSIVLLYPNPNNGRFTLQVEGNAAAFDVKILDMLGKMVHSARIESGVNRTDLDVSHLAAGIYQVSIQQGSEMKVLKMNISR